MIYLQSPKNKETVSLLTKEHLAFFKAGGNPKLHSTEHLDWLNLVKQGEDNTFPNPVCFRWNGSGNSYTLTISDQEDFSDSLSFICDCCEKQLFHLYLGQEYFWKVTDDAGDTSEIFRFITDSKAPRWIKAEGLSNVRDIGGWNGIRQGMVYRGCEMEFHHTITSEGTKTLRDTLNIKTDLDLRGEAVGKITQSALGSDVNFALIPAKAYGEFLEEKEVCARIFRLFTNPDYYPFYVHCWGGADRTGTVIFLLCGLLGMSEENLYLDYELTSFSVWEERSRSSDLFQSLINGLQPYGKTVRKQCEAYLLSTGLTREELQKIKSFFIDKNVKKCYN